MNIKKFRKAIGLTQKQVAEKAECSEAAVCLYESGKRVPKISTAYKIAQALGVTIDELMKAG